MALSFRANLDQNSTAAANEILVLPAADVNAERLGMALLAIERGIDGFRHGAGPLDVVVVPANPSFDDLLAASTLLESIAGRTLPAGLKSFASYAALQREGISPGSMSPEQTLEGVFLAIRNAGSGNLLDPVVAKRFETDWFRMGAVIFQAAAKEQDSFTVPLFDTGPEFARERAYLANDRMLYRQDLQRAEQWSITIPGAAPSARALILHQPKSLLFKQWSRSKTESPQEEPFALLAVDWGKGRWFFSTNPGIPQPLSLEKLFERLQQAELKHDRDRAVRDPWTDPPRFNHTYVAPPKAGSQLADAEVLKVARQWCHGRTVRKPIALRAPLAAAAAICVALAGYAFWPAHATPHTDSKAVMRSSLEYLEAAPSTAAEPLTRDGKDFALLFASNVYSNGWPTLSNAESDALAIGDELEKDYGFEVDRTGIENTRDQFAAKIMDYRNRQFGPNDQLLIYLGGHGERIDGRGYLVFKDSSRSSEHHTSSYYSLADLHEDISIIALHCPHVFLVLDKLLWRHDRFRHGDGNHAPRKRKPHDDAAPKNVIFERKMKNRCLAFLASVGKTTASDGRPGTHSPFASTILGLLKSAQPGALLSIPNIAIEVDKDPEQDPRYALLKGSDPGGDFVFLRRQ